jgi:Fic family protein
MRETGVYQPLGSLSYFIPYPLPPASPTLELSAELMTLYGEASFALGQLNEMAQTLPSSERFVKAYVIKEALLSSEIEGIHTTLIDVLTNRSADYKINKNTQLVLNYTKALEISMKLLTEQQMPIVSRVILEAHQALMSGGEGDGASPGQFRKQSVRVGELVPPPAPEIPRLIQSLEQYMNEPTNLPALIRAGLAHVQFETIHPFLDGNGRIGRLLIVLMLINDGLLVSPIIYPSLYFKKNHLEYYQRLDGVRTRGDFESWIIYYLKAIRDCAVDAHARAKEIQALENEISQTVQGAGVLVVNYLFTHPVTTIAEICGSIGKVYNTVKHILEELIQAGLVEEDAYSKRNKLYYFKAYLDILERDL